MTYTTQQNVVDKVRLSIETTAGQLAVQNRDIPRQLIAQINVYDLLHLQARGGNRPQLYQVSAIERGINFYTLSLTLHDNPSLGQWLHQASQLPLKNDHYAVMLPNGIVEQIPLSHPLKQDEIFSLKKVQYNVKEVIWNLEKPTVNKPIFMLGLTDMLVHNSFFEQNDSVRTRDSVSASSLDSVSDNTDSIIIPPSRPATPQAMRSAHDKAESTLTKFSSGLRRNFRQAFHQQPMQKKKRSRLLQMLFLGKNATEAIPIPGMNTLCSYIVEVCTDKVTTKFREHDDDVINNVAQPAFRKMQAATHFTLEHIVMEVVHYYWEAMHQYQKILNASSRFSIYNAKNNKPVMSRGEFKKFSTLYFRWQSLIRAAKKKLAFLVEFIHYMNNDIQLLETDDNMQSIREEMKQRFTDDPNVLIKRRRWRLQRANRVAPQPA